MRLNKKVHFQTNTLIQNARETDKDFTNAQKTLKETRTNLEVQQQLLKRHNKELEELQKPKGDVNEPIRDFDADIRAENKKIELAKEELQNLKAEKKVYLTRCDERQRQADQINYAYDNHFLKSVF